MFYTTFVVKMLYMYLGYLGSNPSRLCFEFTTRQRHVIFDDPLSGQGLRFLGSCDLPVSDHATLPAPTLLRTSGCSPSTEVPVGLAPGLKAGRLNSSTTTCSVSGAISHLISIGSWWGRPPIC